MQTIAEKIKQRRYQMMVHSYLYYHLNENIVSDSKWSEWAMELVELQKKYPDESKRTEFYEEFKDWDGNSGAFLKFPEKIKIRAEYLLNIANGTKTSNTVVKTQLKSSKRKVKSNVKKLF